MADQISTPQAGAAWGVLSGLFLGLFLVVRLPKGRAEPELAITRFAFVARASVSGTIGMQCVASCLYLIPKN